MSYSNLIVELICTLPGIAIPGQCNSREYMNLQPGGQCCTFGLALPWLLDLGKDAQLPQVLISSWVKEVGDTYFVK